MILVKSLEQERAHKQEAAQASSRVPLLKNAFQKISMSIKNLNSIIVRKENIKSELLFEFAKFENIKKPTNKTLTNLKEERLGLEHNQKKIDSQISKLEERISNFVSIIQNKKCPICERIVDAEDFTGKKSHFTVEHEELKRSSKSYTDRIKAVDYLIEELAKFNEANKERKKQESSLVELDEFISTSRQSLKELQIEEKAVNNEINVAEQEASKEIKVQQNIDILENRKNQAAKLIDELKHYQQAQKELQRMTAD